MIAAGAAARSNAQIERLQSLEEVEFSVFSQWGDDGIIDWLCCQLPISSLRFVEFGVENYRESNTRFLLKRRNWSGLVIDSSLRHVRDIRQDSVSWQQDLQVVHHHVTAENINRLFEECQFTGRIGLLSIDIDGNDYWVWQAVEALDPDIVVCEYNAVFGDVNAITIPYDPAFDRTRAHFSNLYFGAGIRALESLASIKGYQLVGSNSAGNNAFFVRKELAGALATRIIDREAKPSLFRESRDRTGNLSLIGGFRRVEAIAALEVVDVETGKVHRLADLDQIYSDRWVALMGGVADE
jgi:hypothetical protein